MSPASLDSTFAALADPTRRAILARLVAGEASVMELAQMRMAYEELVEAYEALRRMVERGYITFQSTPAA